MGGSFGGKYTARVSPDGCALFLIGMRFNQPWRIDKWGPVFSAMPRMLRYLKQHPEAGMLNGQFWPGRTLLMVSYWRSSADLIRFASAVEAPHREAWRAFNRAVGSDPTVGVWHETYLARPGTAEAVYVNMPRFGLAAATGHVPVEAASTSAHQRLSPEQHAEHGD